MAEAPDETLTRVLAALPTARDFAIVVISERGGELTYHTENTSGKLKRAVMGVARKVPYRRGEGPAGE